MFTYLHLKKKKTLPVQVAGYISLMVSVFQYLLSMSESRRDQEAEVS